MTTKNRIENKKVGALNVFFDTEFTKFRSVSDEPKLISIGFVTLDGREFYAELSDTYQVSDCSQFVIDVVLPLLDKQSRMMEAQLVVQLKSWIEGLGADEVVLRCDAPSYDWQFLVELFNFRGMWPTNLRQKSGMVFFENPNLGHRYNAAIENYWKDHGARQHHALVDAKSMAFAWKYATRKSVR